MYITSTESNKQVDRDDSRTRQIFGERIVHFFTLGELTKQTTLSLKKIIPISTRRKFLQSSLMAISLTFWEMLMKQL